MTKELKHPRNERKKPLLSLKEKRAKKLAKRQHKIEHIIEERVHIEDFFY